MEPLHSCVLLFRRYYFSLSVERVDVFTRLDQIFGVPVLGFRVLYFSTFASTLHGMEPAMVGLEFTTYCCFRVTFN